MSRQLEIERIAGAGPTLLFLHEGLGSLSAWHDFPRRLAQATGLGAIVYSRAGYGQSPPRTQPWPLSFMHDEARAVLPSLLAGLDEVILFGHSDGASIALIYAAEHAREAESRTAEQPRLRGLVLEAPHVFVEDVCVQSIARVRAAWPDGKLRARLARHHRDPDGAFLGWSGAWLDRGFRDWEIASLLPRVRAPLLVIQGEDDEYGTLAQVDTICREVAAPSQRLILPGCGHSPHRALPDGTLAAAHAFIAKISSEGW